jgi:hypothetical protein
MGKLLRVVPSNNRLKKYDAIFDDRVVSFGAKRDNGVPYDDFLSSGNVAKREAYLARHRVNENWNDPYSAGSLSRWLLWGPSRSLATNIRLFKERFSV